MESKKAIFDEAVKLLKEIGDCTGTYTLEDPEIFSLCLIIVLLDRVKLTLYYRNPYNHDDYEL